MFHVKRSREGGDVSRETKEGGVPVSGGGLPSLPPAAPAFSLLFAPIPPTPFPRGEGGDFWFSYARGSAPCILSIKLPTALTVPAASASGGGVSGWSPAALAFSLLFCPHPPCPPSRREGGDQGYFMQGAPPLASPGLSPGGTGSIGGGLAPPAPLLLNLRGAGLPGGSAPAPLLQKPRGAGYAFGTQPLKYYRKHPCQCIFMKVLGGSGDSFKSPPTSPSPKKSG